ncbi:MFS transporter [Streptomyces sp. MST-110588]|uniref:MFS transporter n=1 Tax=Streptomyces sp. MST-110588 TaxID=2833628 RepID=UPI001F5DD7C8|nr:MFS transporter [Streptomyces sp. MST-110588]UNO38719.1 MFS transporter [Streptomyces sp. MST-110588]
MTGDEAGGGALDAAGACTAEAVEPSPLRDRRFRIFATGNALNNVGEAVYATVLPLMVYDLTGSLAAMSLLAAAIPLSLVAGPWLGSAADRWGPRVLVVPGLLVQATGAVIMNLGVTAGHAPTWLLFGCAFLIALGGSAYLTGWVTGVPGMFPDCKVRARGTLNSIFFATTVAGPLLITATLPWIGYTGLLWLNAMTFAAPIAVWAMGIHPPRKQPVPAARPRAGRGVREGWRAITSDPRMLTITVVHVVLALLCGTGLQTLLVYDLRHSWHVSGATSSAVILAANACMLLGNLLVAQRATFRPHLSLTLGTGLRALTLFLLVAPLWPVFVGAMALGALGQGAVLSTMVMMRVKYVSAEVLGRSSGLLSLLAGGAALLSPVLTPALSHALGVRGALLVLGLLSLSTLFYLRHTWRAWEGADRAVPTGACPATANATAGGGA